MREVEFSRKMVREDRATVFVEDLPKAKVGEVVRAYCNDPTPEVWTAEVVKSNAFTIVIRLVSEGEPEIPNTQAFPSQVFAKINGEMVPGQIVSNDSTLVASSVEGKRDVGYARTDAGNYVLVDLVTKEVLCSPPRPLMSDIGKLAKQNGWNITQKVAL